MTDNRPPTNSPDEPQSSNHVIWGMTLGIGLGTVLGFFVFDSVGVGVAIGIVLGFFLSVGFWQLMK